MLRNAAFSPDARPQAFATAVSPIREFFRASVGVFQGRGWFRGGRRRGSDRALARISLEREVLESVRYRWRKSRQPQSIDAVMWSSS